MIKKFWTRSKKSKPIEPVSVPDFIEILLRICSENPKYHGVFATIDDRVIGADDIQNMTESDIDRIVIHGLALKG